MKVASLPQTRLLTFVNVEESLLDVVPTALTSPNDILTNGINYRIFQSLLSNRHRRCSRVK